MSEFQLELHPEGFNEARKSAALQANLRSRAQKIAEAAGGAPDYEVIDSPSGTRARVVVRTATPEARKAEATNRTLTRALDAGRG